MALEMSPPPDFLQKRLDLFDKLKKEQDAVMAAKPREKIIITMPNGDVKEGTSWETTPADIAKSISNSLYKRTVVARLDGDKDQLWDLERPLERSCKLELLDFETEQGKQVFWHSSAHILGEACERRFGCSLCIGPPIERGFYYEMALPDGAPVHETDWKPLESIVGSIVKEKQKFERLIMSKEDLLEMFNYNKYKQHIIKDKIPDGTYTTVYRNGPLIDLCRGPHVPDTSRIAAFAIEKNSASYFLGNQENDSLQRVYGVSFPDKKLMAAHKKFLEEAAKRDHRKLGKDQQLFFFHEMSPGSALWEPHGAHIYDTLETYLRKQYRKRRYRIVKTPNMFNTRLWETSGHWNYYKDDMFVIPADNSDKEDKEQFALKPMNCPGHCLIFSAHERSHRELPIRMADFGALHRNEASGALSGLTRVRRFQQDDAHIFCREDQIKAEMDDLFDFLKEVYDLFGFSFKLKLSTRPEKYMGERATWDRAESMLRDALDEFTKASGTKWELNEGDGAFYGPKIDITITDCLEREWQCATIQLDFQQPVNFNLEYATSDDSETKQKAAEARAQAEITIPKIKAKDPQTVIDSAAAAAGGKEPKPSVRVHKSVSPGCARPVMIHRAMFGSFERFTAILAEHYGGKWPFWLSPRQILVVPVGKGFYDYAEEVAQLFYDKEMEVDVDTSGNTLQKKIRTGQLKQYNFIFVVGAEEMASRQVNVRWRDDPSTQDRGKPIPLDEVVQKLVEMRESRSNDNPFPGLAKEEKKVGDNE